ncbi:MAG: FtsQ-type POTRA domain-containing protein [Pseudomonadota bacterium]
MQNQSTGRGRQMTRWWPFLWWWKRKLRLISIAATAALLLWLGGFLWSSGMAGLMIGSVGSVVERTVFNRELALSSIKIEGLHHLSRQAVLESLGVQPDQPLIGFDLADAHSRLARLGWVKHVRLQRKLTGELVITITEHIPIAIWLRGNKGFLIGASGNVIAPLQEHRHKLLQAEGMMGGLDHNDRPHPLPFISGEGAHLAFKALHDAVAETSLAGRIRTAQMFGRRRWDITLDDQTRLMLAAGLVAHSIARYEQYASNIHRKDPGALPPIIDLRLADRIIVSDHNPAGPERLHQDPSGSLSNTDSGQL